MKYALNSISPLCKWPLLDRGRRKNLQLHCSRLPRAAQTNQILYQKGSARAMFLEKIKKKKKEVRFLCLKHLFLIKKERSFSVVPENRQISKGNKVLLLLLARAHTHTNTHLWDFISSINEKLIVNDLELFKVKHVFRMQKELCSDGETKRMEVKTMENIFRY